MALSTASRSGALGATDGARRMPVLAQVLMMTWRSILIIFRQPAAVVPPLIISGFFLLVYQASLSNIASLPAFGGADYLGFILPVSVVSAALSGAGIAGQTIVQDIETGYFDKLLLTPINRGALLLGPIVAGALVLGLQAVLVTAIGLLLGLDSATGALGIATVVGLALLLGIGFAGFTAGIALRTGNAAATQGATFAFFPLTFITATFVPVELLSGWIKVAAPFNPITYLLAAMRGLLNTGWERDVLLQGVLACLGLSLLTFGFALLSLRARTRQV